MDRPVAYGGWMRNGAGVGVWFKPSQQAHTSVWLLIVLTTFVGKMIRAFRSHIILAKSGLYSAVFSSGSFETVVDNRQQLWRDGTSWYETHQGDQSVFLMTQTIFGRVLMTGIWFGCGVIVELILQRKRPLDQAVQTTRS